jgi:Asp-tRNA(Asn)/Glu-tRNA(Gln) amidotransferase A subunit family amidase
MRGSLLGIATDIGKLILFVNPNLTNDLEGGSIRVPAAFSGLYGLKGSQGRIPHGGLSGVQGGMENVVGVIGPVATCFEDLSLFCEVRYLSEG